MTVVSALVTRASNELNDTTSNTFAASMTGIAFSELTQYAVDTIADYSQYVYREIFDNSIITSANTRSYVISGLTVTPEIITRVEYVVTSTSIHKIPDVDLWNGTMYLFDGDTPLYTDPNKYFNIWYLGRHDIPSASSASLTLPQKDEQIIVDGIKAKAAQKMAIDQRGINQDSAAEFLNIAQVFENRYKSALKRATTPYISFKG